MLRDSVIGAWIAAIAVVGVVMGGLTLLSERDAPAHGMTDVEASEPAETLPPAFDNGVHYWQEDRDQPRPAWPQGRPSV